MNNDLGDRLRGLGSETWNGCECVKLLVVLIRLGGTGIMLLQITQDMTGKSRKTLRLPFK